MPAIIVKLPPKLELSEKNSSTMDSLAAELKNITSDLLLELNNLSQDILESAAHTLLITGNNLYEIIKNAHDAGANKLSICFEEINNTVRCVIEDNGKGFSFEGISFEKDKEISYQDILAQSSSRTKVGGVSTKTEDEKLHFGGNGLGLKIFHLSIIKETNGKGDLTIGNLYENDGSIQGGRVTLTSPTSTQHQCQRRNSYHQIFASMGSQFNQIPEEESKDTVQELLGNISLLMKIKEKSTPTDKLTNLGDGSISDNGSSRYLAAHKSQLAPLKIPRPCPAALFREAPHLLAPDELMPRALSAPA